jgi:protein-S-isoprenylcysteine O-methyltransferase Ste14
MTRLIAFLYGMVAYVAFFVTILYAIGFVGDFAVPKTINSGSEGPIGQALLINAALLALFAVQHSITARPAFKRWWTQFVPKPVERSTFVLLSSLILLLLFWQWRPISAVVWQVENPFGQFVLHGLFWFGWLVVFLSSFLINHFDLFGLRQVYLHLTKKTYTGLPFQTTAFYNYVRHPLLVGFIIAFWSTPTMTSGHLLFAVLTTAYIFVATPLEEADLESFHGEIYRRYREQVPKFIPWRGAKGADLMTESKGMSSVPE